MKAYIGTLAEVIIKVNDNQSINVESIEPLGCSEMYVVYYMNIIHQRIQ